MQEENKKKELEIVKKLEEEKKGKNVNPTSKEQIPEALISNAFIFQNNIL